MDSIFNNNKQEMIAALLDEAAKLPSGTEISLAQLFHRVFGFGDKVKILVLDTVIKEYTDMLKNNAILSKPIIEI